MKESENIIDDEQEVKDEAEKSEKEQLREQIASPGFDRLQKAEKRNLLHQYMESVVAEKANNDEDRKKLKEDALKAHYDLAAYKAFEDQLIGCPSQSFDDNFFEKLDDFTDYVGATAIQIKPTVFNAGMFGLLAKKVIRAAGQEPVDFFNTEAVDEKEPEKEPEKEQIDIAEQEIDAQLNNGMVADPPKGKNKTKGTEEYINDALRVFNTRRSSVFKQESSFHKNVREAASDLKVFHLQAKKGDGLKAKLYFPYMENTIKQYAMQWLDKTHKLINESGKYLEENSGFRMTPAGRDRQRGAKALNRLAKTELKECQAEIERCGIGLSTIYKEIAAEKIAVAEKKIEKINKKMLDNLGSDMSVKDQEILFDAMHDILAGYASNHRITELERVNPNPGREELKNLDFYSARDNNMGFYRMNEAIASYISQKDTTTILNEIKDPNKLVTSLKNYHEGFQRDMLRAPKVENKPVKAMGK